MKVKYTLISITLVLFAFITRTTALFPKTRQE
jgi:hypothetical protein